MHPKKQVTDLLNEIGVKLPAEAIVTASRLGSVTKGKSRRPRNILVKFNSTFWKQELFKNISKAKENEKWNGVHVQDDLPQEVLEQRRELRCLAALAREKGHRVTIKDGAIVIDDIWYIYSDIDNLPDGITMENAKMIQIEGGWAFQSHHAFPSPMDPCLIRHKDMDFHCVEQCYFYDIAEDAGDKRSMSKLRDCENGYEAKRIGDRIKKPDNWNDEKRFDVAAALHEKKFRQNENLKQRLLAIKGKLFEATRDDYFGTGLTLAKKKFIGKPEQKGLNRLGDILKNIQSKLIG